MLAFLPQIVVLTVMLEIIDASGYLSRGAFLMDRVLRLAGLGESFVPLLTAHACAVPAISATRIVRDPQQRLRTLLVLPLMTCSARIPTYGLLIAAFFRGRGALFQAGLFVALYFAGIVWGYSPPWSSRGSPSGAGPSRCPWCWRCPPIACPRRGWWRAWRGARACASCARWARSSWPRRWRCGCC